VTSFELGWRDVAEIAVASCQIIKRFDPVKYRDRQPKSCRPLLSVEKLGSHPTPKRLDYRVVERVTDSSERMNETLRADSLLKGPRGELRTVIRI
jgi:hypothetical protein